MAPSFRKRDKIQNGKRFLPTTCPIYGYYLKYINKSNWTSKFNPITKIENRSKYNYQKIKHNASEILLELFNFLSHQQNANQIYIEISSGTIQNGQDQQTKDSS